MPDSNNSKTSNYATSCSGAVPHNVDPSTAFQYCTPGQCTAIGHCCHCDKGKDKDKGRYDSIPSWELNVWNSNGNGIGSESYIPESKQMHMTQQHPHIKETLQSKISNQIIKQPEYPYITAAHAPPAPINVSKVVNDHDNYIFQNKQLAGQESGRAKIPPIITPPIYSEEYWKINDYMVPSNINSQTNVDLTRSGYLDRNCENPGDVLEPYEVPKYPTKIAQMQYNLDTNVIYSGYNILQSKQ